MINVSTDDGKVIVTVTADNNGEATATIVGESKLSIESRVEEVINAHDLRTKASENGQL